MLSVQILHFIQINSCAFFGDLKTLENLDTEMGIFYHFDDPTVYASGALSVAIEHPSSCPIFVSAL